MVCLWCLSGPRSGRGKMGLVWVTAVCWITWCVAVTEAAECQEFQSLRLSPGESITHWCPAEECSDGKLRGTDLYFKTSDICLAARHAGVLMSFGANVNVTHYQNKVHYVGATAKNRIVSKQRESYRAFQVYRVASDVQGKDVIGEVLLVHNGASDDVLRFTCLSQDKNSSISPSNLRTWDYNTLNTVSVKSGRDSPRMVSTISTTHNPHAVRLLGSHRGEDLFAVVQYPNADYRLNVTTVRASVGDTVIIPFQKKNEDLHDEIYFRHFPGKWTSYTESNATLHLTPAKLNHTGMYIVHENKYNGHRLGAYFDFIVRECKAGYFGTKCSNKCSSCQNGGQCHPRQGNCLCPPGFFGKTCQYACLPGWFGNDCQFRCDKETVGFLGVEEGGKEDSEEDKICAGLTICLPSPYGCSCAAGFTNPTTDVVAPTCTQECRKGYFGADCSQRCYGCIDDECNPFSGTCLQGCESSTNCRKGPPLPEATIAPRHNGYTASWPHPHDAFYFFSQEMLDRLSCTPSNIKSRRHNHTLTTPGYNASNLLPYTSYNVCIVTSSPEGQSSPWCTTVVTLPKVPDVNITSANCQENEGLECTAYIDGDCESYNGPNVTITFTLQTQLSCSQRLTVLRSSVELNGNRAVVKFSDYLADVKYEMRVEISSIAGIGSRYNASYSTDTKAPPPVQNVSHVTLSDSAIRLLWNDPCPTNGEIRGFYVENVNVLSKQLVVKPCLSSDLYERCYDVTELIPGSEYRFKIYAENSKNWSPPTDYNVTFEVEPGPPQAIKVQRGARHLDLSLVLPLSPGGTLTNCTIFLTQSNASCEFNISKEDSPLSCKIGDLEEGKADQAKALCCNTQFCGKSYEKRVATRPVPPHLTGSLGILRKTESTITLRLPNIIQSKDGNSSLVVFVQQEVENKTKNLSDLIQTLLKERDNSTRRKRSINEMDRQCQKTEWIAAQLEEDHREFVVGDGNVYNGFINCALKRGQSYSVGTMGINELLGETTYSQPVVEANVFVTPLKPPSNPPLHLLFLLLLLLPVMGLLIYMRYRHRSKDCGMNAQFRPGVSQEVLSQPDESSKTSDNVKMDEVLIAKEEMPNTEEEAIYENLNLKDPSATDVSNIPLSEVEAYLNRTIGAKEAGENFLTVPFTLTKSMEVARRPENKPKNRFINNLPYDDTRVVLSCINDDPNSDYINANHVKGYGEMRYIASQGPKAAKVSTIADFWRMIIEQKITVIIMVANFVEMGKKKVGEYFNYGQTLEFDGFEVTVSGREQLPHFTVSSLMVNTGAETHQVQHYHYTIWPDHGIPSEATSVARMLTHYQAHHTHGGTIVHCSAGIGRTGTVLQVLLMCEMLNVYKEFNPICVLSRLRMSRARLVENEAQYNLSLGILEEILFGEKTIVSPDYLGNHLEKYASVSKIQYARVKGLPSPLSYQTSKLPAFQSFNRNQSVIPADSNRCYLQTRHGEEAWMSQYINAIRIPTSNRQFMLATEHPLPHTVARFWRLVAETECMVVVFINTLDNQNEDEFPTMLMEPGIAWQVEQYELRVEQTVPYGKWLTLSTLKIASNEEEWIHTVDVYQSLDWPANSQLPPSPYLLLSLAELLQIPRGPIVKPPLLCCSDGVTGCGLVAGMTLIVEQLQREQVVDVYRTVVKLLRSRHQFISSEEQFFMLYTGAATYLQEYSNYGNFQ